LFQVYVRIRYLNIASPFPGPDGVAEASGSGERALAQARATRFTERLHPPGRPLTLQGHDVENRGGKGTSKGESQ
jgi:hypothetical protein